jgi:hypothetical protein
MVGLRQFGAVIVPTIHEKGLLVILLQKPDFFRGSNSMVRVAFS